jgi:hypothetical protein
MLTENTYAEQWIIPAGTVVRLKQTTNFGWMILPLGCKDTTGRIIPRRIFQY